MHSSEQIRKRKIYRVFIKSNKKKTKIKEIILHVGLHKTATASIQRTLYLNDELLKKKDYLYPKCWPYNHSIPIYSAFCDHPENYHINIKKKYSKEDIKKIVSGKIEF